MTVEEGYEKRLAELRDRVQYAESLNRERDNDVHHLRRQISILLGSHKHGNQSVPVNFPLFCFLLTGSPFEFFFCFKVS